ncbi:MAG TPA: hypothetical protein VHG72_21695 [Polyangia bacterium]|nr:hypothetical protein [Polyangia bacterium]
MRLVERFEELRTGMTVVFFGCGYCGATHWGVLLGSLGVDKLGRRAYGVLGGAMPECGMIGDETIATEALFRVDDGLDPAADARQAAQDERDAAFRAKAGREAERVLEELGVRR